MLLICVPVLRRPHRVVPLLDSIRSATPEPHRVLFVCTVGDTAEIDAVEAVGADHLDLEWAPGDFSRKSNAAVAHSDEPVIFFAADDVVFHDGWFDRAAQRLKPNIGVVGTNDLGNPRVLRGDHATHMLITRDYIDSHGVVDHRGRAFHEGYFHNFCDTELVETAKSRNAWAFAPSSIVEHLHPHWAKNENDETYDLGQRHFHQDRKLFQRRRRMWT